MRPPPARRKALHTAREQARRLRDESSVFDIRVHLSESLEASQRWYAKQVQLQQRKGGLFEDPYVPADRRSIGEELSNRGRKYEWVRPYELVRVPQFVADGLSRFDVRQGEIGNCWFLAAVASLSVHPELLRTVVPFGQSFDQNPAENYFAYCGMFWFRFFRFGDWFDVVVDDRLPTRHGSLVFMHSTDRREFWSALMEKAFVKLVGSYSAMSGGCTSEAMEDFTGGLTEIVDLGSKAPPKLFQIMERVHTRSSLMACSIDSRQGEIEGEGPLGLINGHAYSITDVRRLRTVRDRVELIRLRNPWGNEKEWRGPWSDQSSEWRSIPAEERQRIGLTFDNDGEFWMSFNDFVRFFSRLEFCHLGPDPGTFGQSFSADMSKRQWEITREEGEWARYSTAGGCRNYIDTFHMNPQYHIEVIDPDETDDDNHGTLIVGLMQKPGKNERPTLHTIGYAIYQLQMRRNELLGKAFFIANQSVTRSPAFTNAREVVGRHKLQPGHYVIIPSTFGPNEESKFLLRIFSERSCTSSEIDDSTSIHGENLDSSIKPREDTTNTERLRNAFDNVVGPRGVLTYQVLRDVLNALFVKEFKFDGFSLETSRSMVALMDTDLSGVLDFSQFKKLWTDLQLWRSIFKNFDRDQSGSLDAFELREVLKMVGFRVSNRVYHAIVCRYANEKGQLLLDDFILLLVRLVTVIETFKAQEQLKDGRAVFDIENFTRSVIYI